LAIYNEQWFIHGVSENVTFLAQQKTSRIQGAMRSKEGVVGKTWPFNRMGATSMSQVSRDAATSYLSPPQSKRRVVLQDFAAAVLIDSFDEIKTLTSPRSEHAQNLAYARNRTIDDLALGVAGLGVAGASGTTIGGILGLATNVDEGAETTATTALPTTQQIVNAGTGMTMAKLRSAVTILKKADVEFDQQEMYIAYSADAMRQLLTDSTVTSSDYSTIQALMTGGFPMDAMWMGLKWRLSTRLPLSGNIRSIPVWAKDAVGYAAGGVREVESGNDPSHWNNPFVMTKLSAGVVRIDDAGVVQVDIDESIA
jgi:hypothetical protein